MGENPTDTELLERFAVSGDERAFREIAARYAGLVFHTARRCLGGDSLADDVAQQVFADLARKAGKVARSGGALPAWLHRAAVLEARAIARSEARHQRRKEALMEAGSTAANPDETAWRDVLPHLDAAIDRLPEQDRRVVLLHYVKGLSFPEIATSLGKSAAAVQKQSRRALVKLQSFLGRRGVTLTVGVLASGLTAEMAKGAPAGFVVTSATAGVVGSAGNATAPVLASKAAVAIGATALLCGVPLAKQQLTLQRLERELAAPTVAAAADRPQRSGRKGGALGDDFQRLAADLAARGTDVPRYLRARDRLEQGSDEELVALVPVAADLPDRERTAALAAVFDTLFERHPGQALSAWLGHGREADEGVFRLKMIEGVSRLIEEDHALAMVWFREHLGAIRGIPVRVSHEPSLESELRILLSHEFIFSDPAAAVELLAPVPVPTLEWELGHSFGARYCTNRLRENPGGLIEVVGELFNEEQGGKVLVAAAGAVNQFHGQVVQFDTWDAFLDEPGLSPRAAEELVIAAGRQTFEAGQGAASFEHRAGHYRDWLERRGFDGVDRRVGVALARMRNWKQVREMAIGGLLDRDEAGLSDEAVVGFLEEVVDCEGSRRWFTPEEIARFEELEDSLADPDRVRAPMEHIRRGHP